MVQRRFSGVEERLMHWANRSMADGWPADGRSSVIQKSCVTMKLRTASRTNENNEP